MWTRTSSIVLIAGIVAGLLGLALIDSQSIGSQVLLAQDMPAQPAPGDAFLDGDAAAPEGAEIQIRGPVHEAFAKPVGLEPQPGPIVSKAPPEPIEEIAPDEKPEGENVVWIPGYWAWDDDREDFLWISGLWRNMPPGHTWVPGYWTEVGGSHQWVPGFWTTAADGQVTYLTEAPPESLENGPTSPAPSDTHFWIPGSWHYQQTRYVWQPGYWAMYQPDWIWVPAHYVWCPSGYVFVPGYWDWVVARRGCLFAPVYFTQPIYTAATFVYRPSVVFSIGFFGTHLFARPSFCHYYVGDYYAASYVSGGFYPWFELNIGGRRNCDPLLTYYNCRFSKSNPHWITNSRKRYDFLREHDDDRPPHHFKDQEKWLAKKDRDSGGPKVVLAAVDLKDARRRPDAVGFKLEQVSQDRRREADTFGKEVAKFAQQRKDAERKGKVALATGDQTSAGKGSKIAKSATTLSLPSALSAKARIPLRTKSSTTNTQGDSGQKSADTGSKVSIGGKANGVANLGKSGRGAPTDWPRTNFDFERRGPPMIDKDAENKDKIAADENAAPSKRTGVIGPAPLDPLSAGQPRRGPFGEDNSKAETEDQKFGLPSKKRVDADASTNLPGKGQSRRGPVAQDTGEPGIDGPKLGLPGSGKAEVDEATTGGPSPGASWRQGGRKSTDSEKQQEYSGPGFNFGANTSKSPPADRTLKPYSDTSAQNAAEYARRALDPRTLAPGGESRAYRALREHGRSLSLPSTNPSLQPLPSEFAEDEASEYEETKQPMTHFGLGSGPNRTRYSLGPTPSGGLPRGGLPSAGSLGGSASSLQGKSPGSIMPGSSMQLERPYSRTYPRSYQELQNQITDPRFRRN